MPGTHLQAADPVPASPSLRRRLGAAAWDLKTRLQFTGWLQYTPPLVLGALCLLLAGLGQLVGAWPWLLVWPPLALGGLLWAVTVFDLLTVKAGLRPPEPIPRPRDDLDAFDLMRARRSCRSFQSRPLTTQHREALLACAAEQSRPEALLGQRPIRFEYVAAPLTVWPVVGAREFLVALAPREYDRGAVIDVGRSLHKVVLQATRMGLATCWIGPGADHASIVRHLGDRFDAERDHIICACAVGYASRFRPLLVRLVRRIQRRRLPLDQLFFADRESSRPLETSAPPFDRFGRCFEVCRWAPSSFNAQPTRCVGLAEGGRPLRLDFHATTPSRFYAPVALGIWLACWETGCEVLGLPGRLELVAGEGTGPRPDASWIVGGAAAG